MTKDQEKDTTNIKLDQALYYAEKLRWSVIPAGENKIPLIEWKKYQTTRATKEEITEWFTKNPKANIGIVTGEISNLIVVDIDPRHGGTDKELGKVITVKSKTGGAGWHYFFQYEEGIQNHTGVKPGIDVRAEGGYVIVPPSISTAGEYEWLMSPQANTPIAPLPDFVKELIKKSSSQQSGKSKWNSELLNGVDVGKRNDSAASVAGKLLKNFPEEEWESVAWPLLQSWNKAKNAEPLSEEELKKVFESIKKKEEANNKKNKDSLVLQLVEEIKKEDIIFFHDQFKRGYAALKGDGREILKLRSGLFKQYIAHHIYKKFGKIISADTLTNIIQLLEGKAIFDGEQHELNVRITEHADAIWYDIGNGSAIHIDKSGWRKTKTPPILFKRFPHQLTQVEPAPGGNLEDLSKFINLQDEEEQLLFLIYTVAAFIPNFPHPILVLYGPQGSGKTTPLRLLKSLIDPSVLKTLTAPDALREFVQLASHHYFLFLDNLSDLPDWLSDALARACTGDGFTKRELFSDDDDVIYAFQRPIALNGINLVVEKADLLDRSLLLGLERITKNKRREEKEFWQEFEALKPAILGAIFDAVVLALIQYPNISLTSYPRMADFTRWGCAIARALGYDEQQFLSAYNKNINSQNDAAIEASPIGITLLSIMEDQEEWEGTATDLLIELESRAEKLKVNIKVKEWPKDPSWLTRRIQLIHSNLAEQGLKVIRDDTSRPRRLLIQKVKENPVAGVDGDGIGTADATGTTAPTPFSPISEEDVKAIFKEEE